MSPHPRPTEAPAAFREIVMAWVLAGIMFAVLALLPSRDADGPAESPTAAEVVAHAHRFHAVPAHSEDPDLLGPCDFDDQDAEPTMQSAHAREAGPRLVPEDGDESDDC